MNYSAPLYSRMSISAILNMDRENQHVQSLTDEELEDQLLNGDAAEDLSDEEEIEPTVLVPLQDVERALIFFKKIF